MRDSKESGVYIGEHGRVVLERCTIASNASANVEIADDSSPEIRNCEIEDGEQDGILAYGHESSQGLIEKCYIKNNSHAGIEIREGGNLHVRDCHITGNEAAVYAHDGAKGFIVGCDVRGNQGEPWVIESDCSVRHERNIGGED